MNGIYHLERRTGTVTMLAKLVAPTFVGLAGGESFVLSIVFHTPQSIWGISQHSLCLFVLGESTIDIFELDITEGL